MHSLLPGLACRAPRLLRHLRRVPARYIRCRRVLAVLERADVRDDRPPIARRNLRAVVGHRAEAVRDHVEEVANVRVPKSIAVIRRRLLVPPLHDDAIAAPRAIVAGAAVDVVAFLASLAYVRVR